MERKNQTGGDTITWSQRRNLFGLALIIIGLVLLLHNLDIEVFRYVWPSIIILAGAYLIYRSAYKARGKQRLSEFRVFGDSCHSEFSPEIDGADIAHFIGDVTVDLGSARLKSGVNKMDIATFIGDIRVMVPENMPVSVDCSAVLSDIRIFDRKKSGIFLSVHEKGADYDRTEKKLRLSCAAFIGDIKITRVRAVSAE